MPALDNCTGPRVDIGCSPAPAVRYVARQPILDFSGNVHAYELLYRNGPVSKFGGDGEVATRTLIDDTVLFGLQSLANSRLAFVNCSAEILTGEHIRVLPWRETVLEILESVEPGAEVVDACRKLKQEGYRLALDDFQYRPEFEPLIEIADFIKIDYQNTSRELRRTTFARLRGYRGVLLGEKIETQEELAEARHDGCTLFQGYHFCRPFLLAKRKVPANRAVHFRLLQMLQEDPLNLPPVCEAVKSEPALAYRLLRYVNSPLFGFREPVTSIQQAILRIGDDLMRRIGTLAVASELNSGSSPELLRMALVRARFCEVTSSLCALNATEQHLLGLFSLLSAMLQKPMEDALSGLPLRAPIRDALLGEKNPHRWPLDWIESQEMGEFDQADAVARSHGLEVHLPAERFTQATMWADRLLAE